MEHYHIIGGDNQQTFRQEEAGPKLEPKTLWSLKNFKAQSAPFVKEEVLYICEDQKFYAIDATNGNTLWTFEIPGRATPPLILKDTLFIGGSYIDNNLYALDKKTGELLWKFRTGTSNAPIHKSPILEKDLLIFPAGKTVYALNIHTHKPAWKLKLEKKTSYFPVTSGNGNIFAMTDEGRDKQKIFCADMQGGQERWNIKAPDANSHLLFTHNTLFFTDRENHLNMVDPDSGTLSRFKAFGGVSSFRSYLAAAEGLLLLVFGNTMAALHLESMQWAWTFHSKGSLGQPLIADDCMYFATCFDGIYGLELKSGKTIFNIKTPVRSQYPCGIEKGILYMAGSMSEHELSAYSH